MRQMVGHEMKSLPQPASKNIVGDPAHLTEPQQEDFLEPGIGPPLGAKSFSAQLRVERVGHMIDIAGGEPGIVQAETDRALGELMRVVDIRQLAVFDAIEPLLLDGDNELAVDEQRGGGVVIHGIDSKDIHRPTSAAMFFRPAIIARTASIACLPGFTATITAAAACPQGSSCRSLAV